MNDDSDETWLMQEFLALLLLVVFAVMVGLGLAYPADARLFPLIIGTLGLVLSGSVLVRAVIGHMASFVDTAQEVDQPTSRAQRLREWAAIGCAPAYGFLVWSAGFYVASVSALIAMPYLLGYRRIWPLIVLATVTVGVVRIVFPNLMGIRLPPGLLGEWVLENFVYDD